MTRRRSFPVYGSPQPWLPGTAPLRREPWARCACCWELLPVRAVLTLDPWDQTARLDPPLRAPRGVESESGSQERLCAACAPVRWARVVELKARGWTLYAGKALRVMLADLAQRGAL